MSVFVFVFSFALCTVVSAYLLRTPMKTRWVYPFYEQADIVSKMNHLFELKLKCSTTGVWERPEVLGLRLKSYDLLLSMLKLGIDLACHHENNVQNLAMSILH